MTRDEVVKRLASIKPTLNRINELVGDALRPFCAEHGYPHLGRIKAPESLADKIETGRFAKWSEIDDLVGHKVIVPSLGLVDGVVDFLESKFQVYEIKARGSSNKSPDVFRFDSTRFIGFLSNRPDVDQNDPLFKIKFEVQVHTAFEHAWSVTTHDVYKPDKVDWRRLRLASQLKAAVEQLDSLVVGFDAISTGIATSAWPEVDAKAKVVDFLEVSRGRGVVDSVCMPSSIGRFSENFVSLVKAAKRPRASAIVSEVEAALSHILVAINGGAKCPKSLSVYQWWFAILAQAGYLDKMVNNKFPLPLDNAISSVINLKDFDFMAFDWNA